MPSLVEDSLLRKLTSTIMLSSADGTNSPNCSVMGEGVLEMEGENCMGMK